MTEKPYKLKERKPVCENRYYSIYFDSFERDGRLAIENYLVVTPKTLTANNVYGVGILPIMGNKVGLVQIDRHPLEQTGWEVPGGFVEPGESSSSAALRELNEEGGVTCEPENLQDLLLVAPAPSIIGAKIQLFAAFNCYPSESGRTPELGHREFRWFTKKAIETMVQSGEIHESVTLLAYYRTRHMV